ncbi:hypothetical protein VTN77DRAFT_4246 [Rasamsonia byssochlamydoides]|uniref:uncharacterized protein n=1 Tax=Rasamsonia byssochlamydoides TaxID=89139 RepID=UPI0037426625
MIILDPLATYLRQPVPRCEFDHARLLVPRQAKSLEAKWSDTQDPCKWQLQLRRCAPLGILLRLSDCPVNQAE